MTIEITYTQARAGLAKLLDAVTQDREIVIIRRRGGEDTALISADELASLMETAYLLRSPANAQRLLEALGRALRDEGQPMTADELCREVGLDTQEP
jgi:antitoxin YefM